MELIVDFLAEKMIVIDDAAVKVEWAFFSNIFQCPIEKLGAVFNLKNTHCLQLSSGCRRMNNKWNNSTSSVVVSLISFDVA